MQTYSIDTLLGTAGILDQAVHGLLDLQNVAGSIEPPRSLLLEIYRLHNSLSSNQATRPPNLVARLSRLCTAGGTGARLVREWAAVLDSPPNAKDVRSPARVYKIASLTAASLIIPWLLLRKRHD